MVNAEMSLFVTNSCNLDLMQVGNLQINLNGSGLMQDDDFKISMYMYLETVMVSSVFSLFSNLTSNVMLIICIAGAQSSSASDVDVLRL